MRLQLLTKVRGLVLTGALLLANGAHAQTTGTNPPPPTDTSGGLVNPLNGVSDLNSFLRAILEGVIDIGTIVLIMMLVYVGFLFVAARGNSEKLQGAKSALVWTVIGGLILLGATSIQLVIQGTVDALR
ncbi:MAG TPA: TrbC/VirB2 family protein [Candidatus Paceibacterota bacterium]|nr:TrbC/VirB2 family protein [Candidatus Paceibacterota bacterium]